MLLIRGVDGYAESQGIVRLCVKRRLIFALHRTS